MINILLHSLPLFYPPLCKQCMYALAATLYLFFNGLGKASFLATLLEYCGFICANSAGTLSDIDPTSNGILAFSRLVGCAYFRKHKSIFSPAYPSPMTLFNSLHKDNQVPIHHHSAWLEQMRERIWSRIKYEEEMIPSDEALIRHWKRSCWVMTVWKQANSNSITYPPLISNGWKQPTPTELIGIVKKTRWK